MVIWNVKLFGRVLVSVTEQATAAALTALLNSGKLYEVPGDPAAYEAARGERVASTGAVAECVAYASGTADIVHMSAHAAIAAIRSESDPAALDAFHATERAHPKYDGGRRTVLDAIEERRGELAVTGSTPGE